MDKENVVHIHHVVHIHSALKKNEIMAFVGKWKELENKMGSKINQTQEIKGRMFSLICRC